MVSKIQIMRNLIIQLQLHLQGSLLLWLDSTYLNDSIGISFEYFQLVVRNISLKVVLKYQVGFYI